MRQTRRILFALVAAAAVDSGAYAQQKPYRGKTGWGKTPRRKEVGTGERDRYRSQQQHSGCSSGAAPIPASARTWPPLVKLSPSGRFLKSFGAGMFAFPHGIHITGPGTCGHRRGRKDGKGHRS